ncbi:hypothetical protein AB0E63_39050 [Kribbella sp. NPDC026596]|uniref:hypothetical protein n=1 Tax=Kribbella sp. NPDC026596 TaxID=3155122 RepID=UPI0033DB1D9B
MHDRGLAAALRVGALTADAVALEARLIADNDRPEVQSEEATTSKRGPVERGRAPRPLPRITSLTKRRLAQLPPDTRPVPSLEAYDLLLPSRRAAAAAKTAKTIGAANRITPDSRADAREPRKHTPGAHAAAR